MAPLWALSVLLWAGVTGAAAEGTSRYVPEQLRTGAYLSPLQDHPTTGEAFGPTSTREFVDLMKHSTPFDKGINQGEVGNDESWVHYNIPEDVAAQMEFRPDGYPVRLPSFEQWSSMRQMSVKATIGKDAPFVQDGVYLATWQGVGNISFEGDAQLLNMTSNSAHILVRPATGVVVRIIGTEEADPLHGIKLVHTAHLRDDGTAPTFHPQFLSKLAGASVLRFTAWQTIDVWNVESRLWSERTLTTGQTQAGPTGVAVEHMVELANMIGADAWFSMPEMPDATAEGVHEYASAFADLVRSQLREDLRVYIEYGSCCLNGLANGWDTQENAVQSLKAWDAWEAAFSDNTSRVINIISSLAQIDKFGSDIGRIEAAAIETSFGELCTYGEEPCVDYNSFEAPETYGDFTPAELVDEVLWPAMLKKESEANRLVQQALHYGLEVVAFNALPLVSARSYGHRGTLSWASSCETCLMQNVGHRYGLDEREQLAEDGWLFEANAKSYLAYEGLSPLNRVPNATYWMKGSPGAAKVACDALAECKGFIYVKHSEWSCGVGNGFRYGDCEDPGTAYFINASAPPADPRVTPPTHCDLFSVPPENPAECEGPGQVDSYFKAHTSSEREALLRQEQAALEACGSCQYAFNQHWYSYEMPEAGFTLDRLHRAMPDLIEKAAQEQALEQNMIEALREDAVEDLMLHYLERLRHLGFETVVGGPMHREVRLCRTGGKACGIASMNMHPDDNSPVSRAFVGYSQGVRGSVIDRNGEPPAPCAQPCVYGVCESGSCRCWARASGADCSVLDEEPRCERPLGISLSGVSYWTREWIFVDVFKHASEWIPKDFTSWTWNTGAELNLRGDGYPASLLIGQAAQALTVWALEEHYTDGWYTVLFDGEGVLEFDSSVTAVRRLSPGRILVYLELSTQDQTGLAIKVSHTREEDPVRNIRIVTPGFEDTFATSPFHPAYLASLKRFTVLRFMDWMHANNEETPWEWEHRAKPEYFTQAGHKGVSLEYMVRLSNELAAHPWFSLPTNASDEYIGSFAALVEEQLRPDLDVYIELGNEVWHPGFYGGQYAQQQGAAEGISFLCWYMRRTAEMAAIAKPVLAAQGRRVIVVAGSQSVNSDATDQLLACPGIEQADAIALGPYFNGYNTLPDPESATLEEVLDSYRFQVNESIRLVKEHKASIQASGRPLELLTYESGPAGEGDGSGTDLAIQAHRHDDMREIVRDYLERLDKETDFMIYFASCGKPSRYGSWGLIEAMDQPRDEVVKYLAVQDFLDAGSTCPAEDGCSASDGCNGKGVCGTDDQCYCYRGYSGATCLDASFTDYMACGYRCTFDQGKCEVTETIGSLRAWGCGCHEDYEGATCTRFQCPDGCNQRGHCIASGVCSCFRGFQGDRCEHDCGCNHHGQCGSDGKCICDMGYRLTADGDGCEWDCDTADTLGCVGPGQSACGACEGGTCVSGKCRCWAGYSGAACDVLDASIQGNYGSSFGINVAHNPSLFVDVMKSSRDWVSIWDPDTFAGQFSYQGNSILWENKQWEWGTGQEIAHTEDGYVSDLLEDQSVITLMLRDVCLHGPSGRYVVTYDGDGEIDFGMDAKPVAFQKGRIDIDFTPTCREECWFDKKGWEPYCSNNGLPVTIRRTNPSNPLRNIRVIMPGFFATHEAEPFHPWVLKNLERFAFVRLMDWSVTNSESHVKRPPISARFVRFTYHSTRGGGAARLSEILFRNNMGATVPCTSEAAPAICDGDPSTDWAPASMEENSVVVELPEGAEIANYMWVTSGWNNRVDPVTWTVEATDATGAWEILDERTTRQSVTGYRRRFAATDSSEERSWYSLRRAGDMLHWENRVLPSHRHQHPVALEYQVLLTNTLGADPWVCVHHLANDDYVRKEAEFWLEHLRPDRGLYVEHSNEVWNPLFPQGRYATTMGTNLGLVDATCRTNEAHCARVRYNAWRSKQIFQIWTEVWGSQRSRLKFVLSTQAAWADVTRDLVSADGVGTAGADLLGITGYMGPEGGVDSSYSSLSPVEVIERFEAAIPSAAQSAATLRQLAEDNGLGIAVYEGGVGLVEGGVIGGGEATGFVTELLMATGRHPAMKPAVKAWLDMFQQELGDDTPFGYFVDTGFWSKYGQWGMREYYDASTANSPAASAVHEHLDERFGALPACVREGSRGRGLPPDSFLGPPAVSQPQPGAQLVVGKRYRVQWPAERLAAGTLDLYLWQGTSCSGNPVPIGSADMKDGFASWQVPDVSGGADYFVELRPRTGAAPAIPSNYTSLFSVVPAEQAPLDHLLYVENDVDLLSAFHRDCKKDKDWAITPDFKILSCVFSSAEGCRTYRTSRKTEAMDGPAPWRHGSFKPLTDCTLHVVGLRQTMRLEGLTRGFDLSSTDSLARIVANVSQLPPGAVAITVVGAALGRRRLNTDSVELEVSLLSDDGGLASAATGLATLSANSAFAKVTAEALGEPGITIMSGNITAEEQFAPGSVETGQKCAMISPELLARVRAFGFRPVGCPM